VSFDNCARKGAREKYESNQSKRGHHLDNSLGESLYSEEKTTIQTEYFSEKSYFGPIIWKYTAVGYRFSQFSTLSLVIIIIIIIIYNLFVSDIIYLPVSHNIITLSLSLLLTCLCRCSFHFFHILTSMGNNSSTTKCSKVPQEIPGSFVYGPISKTNQCDESASTVVKRANLETIRGHLELHD
jgi:hypothetical protein